MAYSEYNRALAVEIVARNGGVLDVTTLADIRDALGLPELKQQTVRYWLKTAQNDQKPILLSEEKKEPTKANEHKVEVTQKVKRALDEKLEIAAHKFVNHATKSETMKDMSSQAAMTSAAIAIDKMRLLRDLPTEIVKVLPVVSKLNEALSADGLNLGDALEVWLNEYLAEKAKVASEGQTL